MTKIKDFFKHIVKKFKQNWRKILLWLVLLVFAVCGMVYSWTRKNKGEIVSGSADTVNFSFEGSPILSTFSQEFFNNDPTNINNSGVRIVSSIGTFSFKIEYSSLQKVLINVYTVGNAGRRNPLMDYTYSMGTQFDFYATIETVTYDGRTYNGSTKMIIQSIGTTFNGDVLYCEFGNVYFSENVYYNYVTYYDTNNNGIRFLIENVTGPVYNSNDQNITISSVDFNLLFSSRRYYFSNVDVSNAEIYQNGYEDGLQEGIKNKDNAVNEAYTNGKNVGYNLAMETLNNNGAPTFLSLIDAVGYGVTKPFVSLLNFDLLGVNMLDFATSILTIFIVVKIITLFV